MRYESILKTSLKECGVVLVGHVQMLGGCCGSMSVGSKRAWAEAGVSGRAQ